VKPEIVHDIGGGHEVAFAELLVGFYSSNVERTHFSTSLIFSGLSTGNSEMHTVLGAVRTLDVASGTNDSSSFNMANFVALEILLQNLRQPSTRKISRFISRLKPFVGHNMACMISSYLHCRRKGPRHTAGSFLELFPIHL